MQEYQVRILDASKYEATQRLQQNCATFVSKVEQLNSLVKTYLEILDKQVLLHWLRHTLSRTIHCKSVLVTAEAEKIEIEKLKAVGVRNAVATLEEVRLAESKGACFAC